MSADLTEIGYVIKTHGVRGHLKIAFDMQCKELTPGEALYFLSKGHHLPFFIQEIEYLEDGTSLVLLEEFNNREEAGLQTKKDVFGPTEWLSEMDEEEEDVNEFVGYLVSDVDKGVIGKVQAVIDMQEYLLLQVVKGDKEMLLPFHDETLVAMDDKKKTLMLRLPEGLTEL